MTMRSGGSSIQKTPIALLIGESKQGQATPRAVWCGACCNSWSPVVQNKRALVVFKEVAPQLPSTFAKFPFAAGINIEELMLEFAACIYNSCNELRLKA